MHPLELPCDSFNLSARNPLALVYSRLTSFCADMNSGSGDLTDHYLEPSCDVGTGEEWFDDGATPEPHPFARYRSDGDWADGVRPAFIINQVEDIRVFLFGVPGRIPAQTSDRPQIACGYCGKRKQLHSATALEVAERWFKEKPEHGGHLCGGEGIPDHLWLRQQEAA